MISTTDEGWAWIVLLSTFLSALNVGSAIYSFGILNVAFLQRYEHNVATTAIIGSVFLGTLHLTAPISSMVINRFSCRVAQIVGGILAFIGLSAGYFVDSLELFCLTYGLIAGFGLGLCYTVCHVIVSFHFKKYLGLAFGITVAAIGLGLLVSGPLIQYLIDQYGLQGAFLLLGGMALNNVAFAFLMLPTNLEISIRKDRKKSEEDKTVKNCCNPCKVYQWDIFKIKSFVIVLSADFLYTLPQAILLFHLPNLSVLSGSSTDAAALLNTALGIGSTVNRLMTGVAVGPEGVDPLLLYLGFNGILGVISLTFPLYFGTYTNQFIFCVILGTYTGGVNAVRSPLYLHLVGLKYHSTAVGLMFFLEGIAFVIGPPLGGGCFIAAFLLALTSVIWKNVPETQNVSVTIEMLESKKQKSIKRRFSV